MIYCFIIILARKDMFFLSVCKWILLKWAFFIIFAGHLIKVKKWTIMHFWRFRR